MCPLCLDGRLTHGPSGQWIGAHRAEKQVGWPELAPTSSLRPDRARPGPAESLLPRRDSCSEGEELVGHQVAPLGVLTPPLSDLSGSQKPTVSSFLWPCGSRRDPELLGLSVLIHEVGVRLNPVCHPAVMKSAGVAGVALAAVHGAHHSCPLLPTGFQGKEQC